MRSDATAGPLEAILARTLRAYHSDERHGGTADIGERILDALLVPIAREAFLEADDMPDDREVLETLARDSLAVLGEGYHVMALVDPAHQVVVKYAKSDAPVPPLAPAERKPSPAEWARDHGVRADGTLHPAIWQHIRSLEAYGPLAVTNRVYFADAAFEHLAADEQRMLERFRSIGIVRSLGDAPAVLRISYPDGTPKEKQPVERVAVSVLVLQRLVTPLASAIEARLREGDVAGARDLESRYDAFLQQLWRCGVSHLDFSILNIGIVGAGRDERLQIFDPHMGVIEATAREVQDPMSERRSRNRPIDHILRSSRDGSRWALWRVQQELMAAKDIPAHSTEAAAAVVRDFHEASEGIEHQQGSFGLDRFDRTWQQHPTHAVNVVMHAQIWALLRDPLGEMVRSTLDVNRPDAIYDRRTAVLAMDSDRPLAQFWARLRVHENRPLILIANVSQDTPTFVKHWGRVRFPPELDIQDDPAIHYHLRDVLTGERYTCPGDELARRGFVIGLAPNQVHALRVEDVVVEDLVIEGELRAHRDISELLTDCTKRVAVIGDVHGELRALQEILKALGFIDGSDHWAARDGTLVLTGDVGHGRHLQEVFDFIHRLAGEAHGLGGRIVWTLGNHDLYVDREGGQGGEDSIGYRLWPSIREAALHPERHPGLVVQAAYFAHGKLFVHGGILPNIVDLAMRESGAADPEAVAAYVNEAFRRALLERERLSAADLPHEIFRIGTSHTRERRLPGEIGYEPAGVFTPDLRELDHYRYHATLLPQIVGHTASRKGEIRYSPGSWLRRDYIAIDVGRQHGFGNGGLLLTDFGWAAVTPRGPTRLVEVSPLYAKLAREAAAKPSVETQGERPVDRSLRAYFRTASPARRPVEPKHQARFADLSPAQVVSLDRLLGAIRETGRCVVVTDLDETFTAFAAGDAAEDTIGVVAEYLAAGGVLVFSTDTPFGWFYVRLLRPLLAKLAPRSGLLANLLPIVSAGEEVFVFEDGAYRLLPRQQGRDKAAGFDALIAASSDARFGGIPELDAPGAVYIGDSLNPGGLDRAMARRTGLLLDVGDDMLGVSAKPLTNLHRGYQRAVAVLAAATTALRESGQALIPPPLAEIGDSASWTFDRQDFPRGRRVRVRVRGSGFVHAGVAGADGEWDPVYNVPLVPLPQGSYEAVLPSGVNAFTFFWTEPPWTPGLPGHWERGRRGRAVFRQS